MTDGTAERHDAIEELLLLELRRAVAAQLIAGVDLAAVTADLVGRLRRVRAMLPLDHSDQ
jgi:hypothetical protein